MPVPRWPKDVRDVVHELWGAGRSAGQIAYELGRGYDFRTTRNAVMGQIHRAGLKRVRTESAAKPDGGRASARKRNPREGFRFKTAPTPVPVYDFGCRASRLPYQWVHDTMPRWRHENGCRFIEGAPDSCREGGFCNRPIMRGSKSWCEEHYAIVWEARRGGSPRPKFRSKYSTFPVVDGTVLILDE